MGTRNYPWNFILSVLLCTMMVLEGRNATAATPESHVNESWSTNSSNRTGPDANRNGSMAEPNTQTAHSLLGTSLSPFMMMVVDGEEKMNSSSTMPAWEGSTSRVPPKSSAFPTTGTATTVPSTGTESGTTSSPPLSTDTTSHSSSSTSSSSSPKGSPAVTPSPGQSSTSSTTETPSAITSRPSTALVLPSPSSTAAVVSAQGTTTPRPVAATSGTSPASGTTARLSATLGSSTETWTSSPSSTAAVVSAQGTTTPGLLAATSGTSPALGTTEARLSATLGSSTETWTAQLSSTSPTQEQPTVEVTATSSPSPPSGSPSPSVSTASAGSSATIPPGEWESSTMNEGSGTTTDPSVGTSHSLPATSLLSLSTTGMVRTGTTPGWGGSSLGMSPWSGAVSSAFPTTGSGTTTPSMDTGSGTDSSLSFSSATTSHSSFSSAEGSSAVTPSPEQQSSTSSTAGMLFITTSQPSTALVFPTAGVTGVESDTVTAETPSPAASTASTNPGAPASITSPASGTSASSHSPTPGSSTETPAPGHSSTPPTQGQPTVGVTSTSPLTGSPSPSTTTASAGSSATIPPEEGKSSTTNQGSRTTAGPIARTSHSPRSTSLATPSTTNLSISTSVNPSFTGACLPVSIEVQKVTGKEIQLSWTSGSKGSLYIISVMDGKEINKTTTEDTKAVLKNLLPGHVYNISVAESFCAENNQTLVSVRTDPDSCFKKTEFCLEESTGCSDLKGIACSNKQAFFCNVTFISQIFNNTLYNSLSEGYKTMSERIKTDIVEGMRAELGNEHFDVFVLGFRSGSVVAEFLSLLPKEEAVDVDDIMTHLSTVLRNKFGDQVDVKVQPLSAQPPTDNISPWRVAVIVLGVLLGVALVLILLAVLFYIYARRRSGMEFSTLYTW